MISLVSKGHAKRCALVAILALMCASLVMMVQPPAKAAHADESAVKMNRLYNPNSGEHFFTVSPVERDNLVWEGWRDEGIGWVAPTTGSPVYRLYNPIAGEHHYTLDAGEADMLVSVGWNDEGIGWYSDPNQAVALYRAYNPNAYANNHHYTTDRGEFETLLSLGWQDEGVGWYGAK